jgi:asparagine synthase (glutamine-hydrolysing)
VANLIIDYRTTLCRDEASLLAGLRKVEDGISLKFILRTERTSLEIQIAKRGWTNNCSTHITQNTFAVVSGYLNLHGSSSIFRGDKAARFVTEIYQSCGLEYASQISGGFVSIIWDDLAHRLVVANDRFALMPVYFAHDESGVRIGSSVSNTILDSQPEFDVLAWTEFLFLGYILGDKTPYKRVQCLPPATILVRDAEGVRLRQYWDWSTIKRLSDAEQPPSCFSGQIVDRLASSIAWMLPDASKVVMPLSGGLDSRTLLCHAIWLQKPVCTYTFGVLDSWDVLLAQQVARETGIEHHLLHLDENYLARQLPDLVEETGGMLKLFDTAVAGIRHLLPALGAPVISGLAGDSVFGSFLDEELLTADEHSFKVALFRKMLSGMTEQELRAVLGTHYLTMYTAVFDSFLSELDKAPDGDRALRAEYMNFYHRQRKWVFGVFQLIANYIPVTAPFYDYELFDYALGLPVERRLGERAYVDAFVSAFPNLAQIPWERTGQPLIRVTPLIALPSIHRGFLDRDTWSRTSWRSLICSRLLEPKWPKRTNLDVSAIQNLIYEHMSNSCRHTEALSVLTTLALWQQDDHNVNEG